MRSEDMPFRPPYPLTPLLPLAYIFPSPALFNSQSTPTTLSPFPFSISFSQLIQLYHTSPFPTTIPTHSAHIIFSHFQLSDHHTHSFQISHYHTHSLQGSDHLTHSFKVSYYHPHSLHVSAHRNDSLRGSDRTISTHSRVPTIMPAHAILHDLYLRGFAFQPSCLPDFFLKTPDE